MTHNELQDDLASHLRAGTDRMVWTNTQLGPAASPRPDVFTVSCSYARFRADAYEVKVSVSDLRHDVTSGKWQSYRKFGHAVWFAFPRGMAPLELVPKECGIILRSDSSWRAARKPVAQVLDTLPRDAWLKLLMTPTTAAREPQARHMDYWRQEELARKKFGGEIADALRARHAADYRFQHATDELERAAAAIESDIQRRREDARARDLRDKAYLDEGLLELGVELGLARDQITAQALTRAIRTYRSNLSKAGIQSAIAMLQELGGIAPVEA